MSTHPESESKEQRILRLVKKVLTEVAKDTYTPPELRHPLSTNTINGIRECLSLISARESELNGESTRKPRFIDEPQDKVVVQLDTSKPKK
jgi:hypothetical protein